MGTFYANVLKKCSGLATSKCLGSYEIAVVRLFWGLSVEKALIGWI